MFIQSFSRFGVVLLLAGLMSACSFSDTGSTADSRYMQRGGECYGNRSGCMYEGRYETGERAYAEAEARRLNRASLQRLRRGG